MEAKSHEAVLHEVLSSTRSPFWLWSLSLAAETGTPIVSVGIAWSNTVTVRQRRTQKRFFVDNAIIDEYGDQLGPYGLAVYVALCRHADIDSQECYPSYSTLAGETGMGITSVKKAVHNLVALGLVTVKGQCMEDGRQTSNLYTLLEPPSHLATTPQSPHDCPPVASDTPPQYHQTATNNPNNEQSSITIPPGGGKVVGASQPTNHGEGEDLTPVTPLQRRTCQTFNRNGQFANKTQKKQFLALERKYPDAYLEEHMEWASDKGFRRFVSGVKNPDNFNQWQERQASRPQRLKEISL